MKRLLLCICLVLVACGGATPTSRPAATAEAGAALVEQAVSLLLDRYVEPLDSAALYGAAYRGAADALQAVGQAPQGQQSDFTGDPRRDTELFREAYLKLARGTGAGLDQTGLAYRAIRSATAEIDECHTNFLTPEQFRQLTAGLEGRAEYAGIGVSIRPGTRPVVVGEVFSGTPAARAGLRPGDALVAVDGTDVTALSADQIAQLVRGPAETRVMLTIRRPGEPDERRVTLTRARVAIPVLTSRLIEGPGGDKVGYVRLYSFSTGADAQLQEALERFAREGVTGWVLDLRDNGGGYIDTLAKIAGRFIAGDKPVAYQIERGGEVAPIPTQGDLFFTPQRPLAVLINAGSASSSEALAAALADYEGARLFGGTTAGCLATATTFPLADGSALQITIEKTVSPARREINRVGQPPDEAVAPNPAGPGDEVLDAALRWLVGQRPQGAGRAEALVAAGDIHGE